MKKTLTYLVVSIVVLLLLFIVHFFTIRHFDKKILESTDVLPALNNERIPGYVIPSHFVDGERFYIKIPISSGTDTIMAFGDTGGGVSFLAPKTKSKEGIKSNLKMGIIKGIMPIQYVLYQDVVSDAHFPIPNPNSKFIIRNPFKRVTSPLLMIPPMEDDLKLILEVQPEMDAFLAQNFFMDHAWTIDYPNEQIMVNTPLNDSFINQPNVQQLGFKKNNEEVKLYGHPSMTIEVDGDTIDVLFDTGATFVLSDDGKKLLSTNKKTLGGSFIAASIFDKWRKEHPDWRHYPNADLLGDIIEVPIVKIGGYEVGPVLFAKRQDEAWSKGMIASMDKVVQGAIGGTVLKYFNVTIDYKSELIRFEKDLERD